MINGWLVLVRASRSAITTSSLPSYEISLHTVSRTYSFDKSFVYNLYSKVIFCFLHSCNQDLPQYRSENPTLEKAPWPITSPNAKECTPIFYNCTPRHVNYSRMWRHYDLQKWSEYRSSSFAYFIWNSIILFNLSFLLFSRLAKWDHPFLVHSHLLNRETNEDAYLSA